MIDCQDCPILRRLLALCYAGADLYADDGELQDARELPVIDFNRDTADVIAYKMSERAIRHLQEHQSAPRRDEVGSSTSTGKRESVPGGGGIRHRKE